MSANEYKVGWPGAYYIRLNECENLVNAMRDFTGSPVKVSVQFSKDRAITRLDAQSAFTDSYIHAYDVVEISFTSHSSAFDSDKYVYVTFGRSRGWPSFAAIVHSNQDIEKIVNSVEVMEMASRTWLHPISRNIGRVSGFMLIVSIIAAMASYGIGLRGGGSGAQDIETAVGGFLLSAAAGIVLIILLIVATRVFFPTFAVDSGKSAQLYRSKNKARTFVLSIIALPAIVFLYNLLTKSI